MSTLRVRGEIEVDLAPGADQWKALQVVLSRHFVMTSENLTSHGIRAVTVTELEEPHDDGDLAEACARWRPAGCLYTS